MESLKVKDISKKFGEKSALKCVSFVVLPVFFLSFFGPSGCVKTTLLRILIGLLPPSSGEIYMDNQNITHAPPDRRGMGIVFQNYALFENMSVLRNVEYALKLKKEKKAAARETALHMIDLVGLSEHAAKKPSQLSGGQMQRVAIARTLALSPDIILFDEPMSALDVATRLTLRKELKKIQATTGTTMIYITHDQEEAFAMSDRIMVMNESVIHQIDTPEKIIQNPADAFVRDFVIHNLAEKAESLAKFHLA